MNKIVFAYTGESCILLDI